MRRPNNPHRWRARRSRCAPTCASHCSASCLCMSVRVCVNVGVCEAAIYDFASFIPVCWCSFVCVCACACAHEAGEKGLSEMRVCGSISCLCVRGARLLRDAPPFVLMASAFRRCRPHPVTPPPTHTHTSDSKVLVAFI